ncbi:MAG: TfoX/Sxy family protein [bacterium]
MTPPNPALVDQLREAFEPHFDKEKSMFGCRVFWVDGLICAFVADDRICLRADDATVAKAVKQGQGDYWASGVLVDRPTNYILLNEQATAKGQWKQLLPLAVAYVKTLPPPKPKPVKKPKR